MTKTITVLGSTGSVGQNTLDLINSAAGDFKVRVLTAQSNFKRLAEQAISCDAQQVVIGDEQYYDDLCALLTGHDIAVSAGRKAIIDAAAEPADLIMCAIVGFAGLEPLFKAIKQGTSVAIANKEPLVAAGPQFMRAVKEYGTTVLPVDSEHNGVFQGFETQNKDMISSIVLTASGGPFRDKARTEIGAVTPEQAIAHPNWSMGAKISVDSATMMNKALEIIEAHYLFEMPAAQIKVLMHPQSIVHAMVEYKDGSILSHMGAPDMRTPIASALAWPNRMETSGQKLDLQTLSELTFKTVDQERFPSIRIAYECLARGQAACIAMNAANEIAVDLFLNKQIAFLDIDKSVDHIVQHVDDIKIANLDDVIAFDQEVRKLTKDYIQTNITKAA